MNEPPHITLEVESYKLSTDSTPLVDKNGNPFQIDHSSCEIDMLPEPGSTAYIEMLRVMQDMLVSHIITTRND